MPDKKEHDILLPDEIISNKIYFIRGVKVMLDKDLADLYGVTTGNLNKAVKRNTKRFPEDFMFQLTQTEFDNLIFHFGTSSWGGTRKLPFAFTEQGVAMLSGIFVDFNEHELKTHSNWLHLQTTFSNKVFPIANS